MITRYKLFSDPMADCGCEIDESATGGYVASEDYSALAKERDKARKLLQEFFERDVDDGDKFYDRVEKFLQETRK